MTHKEQLQNSIAVADTQAYALIDERREESPADVEVLKEIRELLAKVRTLSKRLTD